MGWHDMGLGEMDRDGMRWLEYDGMGWTRMVRSEIMVSVQYCTAWDEMGWG